MCGGIFWGGIRVETQLWQYLRDSRVQKSHPEMEKCFCRAVSQQNKPTANFQLSSKIQCIAILGEILRKLCDRSLLIFWKKHVSSKMSRFSDTIQHLRLIRMKLNCTESKKDLKRMADRYWERIPWSHA